MIIYYFGKVYYSRTLSWACTTLVLLSVPAAALAWHLRPHECLSQESQALAMLAVDYWLAATLLSGPLWYLLAYSFARMDDDQPELLALRGTSAVIVAAASTTLVVQVLPRLVLASATALYVGLSLNLGCWWASLWLRLQTDGLAAHLPPSVRRALLHERPIDWLRRSDWTEMVLRARQMLPLLLLPDGELRHGLAQLPPRLRRRLERPGLAALLPNTARQLLEPWAMGPDLLRVRPLPISPLDVVAARPPAPASTTPNGHAHGTSASPAAAAVSAYRYDDDEEEEEEADEVEEEADGELAAAPAAGLARRPPSRAAVGAAAAAATSPPEWLLLYAVRCHVSRMVRDRLQHQLQQAVGPVAAVALETALVRLADFGASAELRAVVGALAALAVGRRLCGVSSGSSGRRGLLLGSRTSTLAVTLGALLAARLVRRVRASGQGSSSEAHALGSMHVARSGSPPRPRLGR
eukprot:jgi/Chrpa1/21660/Chrysochromulina_OHIO_Genome00005341-RA